MFNEIKNSKVTGLPEIYTGKDGASVLWDASSDCFYQKSKDFCTYLSRDNAIMFLQQQGIRAFDALRKIGTIVSPRLSVLRSLLWDRSRDAHHHANCTSRINGSDEDDRRQAFARLQEKTAKVLLSLFTGDFLEIPGRGKVVAWTHCE